MTKLELSSYPDTPAARAELVEFLNRHIPLQNSHGWEQRMIIHSSPRIQGHSSRWAHAQNHHCPLPRRHQLGSPAILRHNQHVCHFFLFFEALREAPQHTLMAEGDPGL